jgi:hypothetical protein
LSQDARIEIAHLRPRVPEHPTDAPRLRRALSTSRASFAAMRVGKTNNSLDIERGRALGEHLNGLAQHRL